MLYLHDGADLVRGAMRTEFGCGVGQNLAQVLPSHHGGAHMVRSQTVRSQTVRSQMVRPALECGSMACIPRWWELHAMLHLHTTVPHCLGQASDRVSKPCV